jgi:hypothetical protein
LQPSIASSIPAHIVLFAVEFESQHGFSAVEIEDVVANGMLTAEFESQALFPKQLPGNFLGHRRRRSESAGPYQALGG